MKTFAALGVAPDLAAALAAAGIETPFPIQALTIPDALAGHNVCGKAQTGSGKTLAFGLPMIMRTTKAKPQRPRALVLVPTRELAHQVHEVLAPLAAARGLALGAVYGGAPMDRQIKALRRGVDIMVATPGRLIDLGDRGEVSMADVEILVLDEADRMVDMGFLPQVEWVLRRLPEQHQTLLFSATLDRDVDHLIQTYVRDPAHHEVVSEILTVESMEHRFLKVHQMDKVKVATVISKAVFRTLVFVRTKRGADRLVVQLRKEGAQAEVLHGGLTQGARQRALSRFTKGDVGLLVATDVAARGLDIDGVDVVIHYDPPEDHKAYLHRSGRTARAGEAGVAVSLLLWDQVADAERLRKRLGIRQPPVEVFSNDPRLTDLAGDGWGPLDDEVSAATGTDGPSPAARIAVRKSMGAGRRRRR
ncbi:MAG TPA: DEAD/DEAH box helicase [Acidimicrobiales bacterium]|jgi:superfamily II DNA/RNA helicase|nr:DEAD/DEAH box helicase [Acidimicrobiales bacterium]